MVIQKARFASYAVYAGNTPDYETHSRSFPVSQTRLYIFSDAGHAVKVFALREPGKEYMRIMNPANDAAC